MSCIPKVYPKRSGLIFSQKIVVKVGDVAVLDGWCGILATSTSVKSGLHVFMVWCLVEFRRNFFPSTLSTSQ